MSFERMAPAATGRPREAGRNVEVMWLLGRLAPDHNCTLCRLCREIGLLTMASVAIDGSKFKAVNNPDRNFTRAKVKRRRAQLEESVARYLSHLDTIDRAGWFEAYLGGRWYTFDARNNVRGSVRPDHPGLRCRGCSYHSYFRTKHARQLQGMDR
jgi:hypothetical protein